MKIRYISFMFLLSALAGCVREDLTVNRTGPEGPSDPEGVDLICMVDVRDLLSPVEVTPGTRAVSGIADDNRNPVQNAQIKNMTSLAFFVVEPESPWRILAYRIIASDDAGDTSEKKFYLYKNPEPPYVRRNFLEDISQRKIRRENDSDPYFDDVTYHDDQHYGCWTIVDGRPKLDDDCVGYNGFARMGDDNDILTDTYGGSRYPAYDSGPDGIPDGKYDFSYGTAGDFAAYSEGDRMRKSGAVILTFKYDNPMHGDIEKLKRGEYYLIAMANFRESVSGVVEHGYKDDLFNESDDVEYIGDHIYHILNHWDSENGVSLITDLGADEHHGAHQVRNFFDGGLSLSEVKIDTYGAIQEKDPDTPCSFIRSNRARIVFTGYQKVTLTPGNTNVYLYELSRITTRATFRITNYSPHPLTVSDFSLSDNFAQAATFLFNREGNEEYTYMPIWQGAPDVSSSKAIVPFAEPTYSYPNTTVKEGAKRIEIAGNTTDEVIFDALMYESSSEDIMGYFMTLGYEGVTPKRLGGAETMVDIVSMAKVTDLKNLLPEIGDKETFFIKGRNELFIKYDRNDGRLESDPSATSPAGVIEADDDDYKFEITRTGEETVTIRSVGADRYFRTPASSGDGTANNIRLVDGTAGNSPTDFTLVSNQSHNGIGFYYGAGSMGYIHALQSNFNYRLVWGNWNDGGSYYTLYRVSRNTVTKPYPIKFFREEVGISENLHTLRRNDHLIVDIGVTFNEKTQDIEFQVKPWDRSDNEIVFD